MLALSIQATPSDDVLFVFVYSQAKFPCPLTPPPMTLSVYAGESWGGAVNCIGWNVNDARQLGAPVGVRRGHGECPVSQRYGSGCALCLDDSSNKGSHSNIQALLPINPYCAHYVPSKVRGFRCTPFTVPLVSSHWCQSLLVGLCFTWGGPASRFIIHGECCKTFIKR